MYRKLPGRRRGLLSGSSAWLAADHLLLVRSARFWEDYRRFYYRDVQAVVVTRTTRFVASWPPVLLGACIMAVLGVVREGPIAWMCIALLALEGLYWLAASIGWSCVCHIQTAVSLEQLPSVYRTWTARKAVDLLEVRVRESQGA
jgi:hypothetical protein